MLGQNKAFTNPIEDEVAYMLFYTDEITEAENAQNFAYLKATLAARGVTLP